MLIVCLAMAVILIGLDQLIKYWALTQLQPISTIPIIQDVLHLTYSENRGAAFSILTGKTELLILISIVLLLMLAYMLFSKKITHPLGIFSTCLVISGGIGNMIDRVFRPGNFVVDYIDFRLINFAIFNLADICIVCGTFLLLFYLIFIDGKQEVAKTGENKENED